MSEVRKLSACQKLKYENQALYLRISELEKTDRYQDGYADKLAEVVELVEKEMERERLKLRKEHGGTANHYAASYYAQHLMCLLKELKK